MGNRVLIVEDNWVEALTLGVFLEDHGYKVVNKLDKAEDVSQYLDESDIILMDINLAGRKTGLDAAEEAREAGHQIPIIFLSAMGDQKTINRIEKLDNCSQVLKPFDYHDLREEIVGFLEQD